MAAGIHHAKFDRLFEIFDAGRDGYVSREDFETVVDRVVSAPHGSPNGTRSQAVRDASAAFWAGVSQLAEVDGAGRLGRLAFRAALDQAFLRSGRFEELLRPAVEAWFDLYDADGDGRIGLQEYEILHRSIGRPAADIEPSFQAIDVDRDGGLTTEEFISVVEEFFTRAEPDAPGNWLFGPL